MAQHLRTAPPALPVLTAELNAASFAQALGGRADVRLEFRGSAVVCRPRDPSIAHRLRTTIMDAPLWDGDALILDASDAPYAMWLFGSEGLTVEVADGAAGTDA